MRREVRTPFAYASALAFAGMAWLLSQQTAAGFPHLPFLIFTVALLASGAVGGQGPAVLAAGCALVTVDYFFVPSAGTWKLPHTTPDIVSFVAFLSAAGLTAVISRRAHHALLERARADAIASHLDLGVRHRDALLHLGARALAGGSVEAVAREAMAVTASAVGVEHCAIFEVPKDGGRLVIAHASGSAAVSVEGVIVAADADTQAGFVLHAREPVIVADTASETRFSLPEVVRGLGVRSGVAARIAAGGHRFGVFAAYSTTPRHYTTSDVQFLCGVAAALAGAYERRRIDTERAELASRDQANRAAAEAAARRAAFLAQTATVFDAALEPEATLVSLARIAVPALADCAIVDLVGDDGHVRRVDVVDIDPSRRDATPIVRGQTPNLQDRTPLARALRTGQPVLLSDGPRDLESDIDREHERFMKVLQCESLLLVPLVARGQTLGLVTLGSRERRYDAGDLTLARELAGRAAVALDNARLYHEAQAASRAKDDFLATISHELRTPINAVLGWSSMLRKHQLDETRRASACEAIERNARAQAQLLEQLLDVSRAISGKLELHLAPTPVSGIVEAAADAVRPDADARRVRVMSRIDASIPQIMVDPERLEQVVINVIANAVKFSPEDGQVDVELRRDEGFAVIVVRDQGVGIKREFLPYVFDRFRQASSPPAANRGLGLGMSIARDIVERHGGSITADSAGEGRGATFTVKLPLRTSSHHEALAASW